MSEDVVGRHFLGAIRDSCRAGVVEVRVGMTLQLRSGYQPEQWVPIRSRHELVCGEKTGNQQRSRDGNLVFDSPAAHRFKVWQLLCRLQHLDQISLVLKLQMLSPSIRANHTTTHARNGRGGGSTAAKGLARPTVPAARSVARNASGSIA